MSNTTAIKKYSKIKNKLGEKVDYEVCVNFMDDDLREELHDKLVPTTEQNFYNEYCKEHLKKFGEEFCCENTANI